MTYEENIIYGRNEKKKLKIKYFLKLVAIFFYNTFQKFAILLDNNLLVNIY